MDKVQEIMSRWNALQPLSERDQEMLSRRFTIDFNYDSNIQRSEKNGNWRLIITPSI